MVRCTSTTRLSSIKASVILTQTDTTVGFISQDSQKLYEIKSRKTSKPFIKVYSDLKTLLACGIRVPNRFKSDIRRAKKTSFIIKNRAFRVAKYSLQSNILKNISWHYSTSANESKKKFDIEFCEDKADIIVEDKNGLQERSSSKLYKINNIKRRKIR